jgi:glyoxylase-like metal-dependent hydrolase (beta-lactamase superfamily II)
MQGILEEAKKRYPRLPIKAVLSTSDSWPHTGGVRFAVSQHLAVYILDLNRPLLDRLIRAPHTLDPDELEKSTSRKTPVWKIVSTKTAIGSGPNRVELYPLRGAATEHQYVVYFPEQHLLYASDTLVINDNNTLYHPELMNEVVQAVKRESLKVDSVFAMHQGPTPWDQVLTLLKTSQGADVPN